MSQQNIAVRTLKAFQKHTARYMYCLRILSILLLSCLSVSVWAQDGGVERPVQSYEFVKGSFQVDVPGTVRFDPGNAREIAPHKITNVVSVSVIEDDGGYLANDFTAWVDVEIKYGHTGEERTMTHTFQVNYAKGKQTGYNAMNYLSFSGAEVVTVTIKKVTFLPETDDSYRVPRENFLLVRNELRATCYYQLDTKAIVSFATPVTTSPTRDGGATPVVVPDTYPLVWTLPDGTGSNDPLMKRSASARATKVSGQASEAGNNQVQLEWTWLDDKLANNYLTDGSDQYNALFSHNATRVDLPATTTAYDIPMLYNGTGKLYYRVRLINVDASGYRAEAPWATGNVAFGGHEPSLNWQATTSFAEEGKLKTVIQYFDGSLRGRQTVTKNNTDQTTLVAETFYDREGRPAVQVLPAPGINSVITYNKDINLFNRQTEGSNPAEIFDYRSDDYPGRKTPPMDTKSGASQYYSAKNAEINIGGSFANIPDAEGYPYTVTRYTPDGTGRIMAQSGVGAALKMGDGNEPSHETKLYYGAATQEEINGLFGTEGGNHSHYSKNMVVDANGQTSVSYVDMHGRTVATALAGNPDINKSLASLNFKDYPNQDPKDPERRISHDLLNGSANAIKGNKIESVSSLLVPVTEEYDFVYRLNVGRLEAGAYDQSPLCYDCLYDLEISVTPEDEENKASPVIMHYNNIRVAPDDDCSTTNTEFVDAKGNLLDKIPVVLDPGSYSVRKTLSLSETSLQTYESMFLQRALEKSRDEIRDSVYEEMVNQSPCDIPIDYATCESCATNLGSLQQYQRNYYKSLGLNADGTSPDHPEDEPDPALARESEIQYNKELAHCNSLCTNVSHTLDQIRSAMLSDMMPSAGQYAQYTEDDAGALTSTDIKYKYNIFSTYGNSRTPYFRVPKYSDPITDKLSNIYCDSHENPDASINNQLATISDWDFIQKFKFSWTNSLLSYHPEYPRLVYALSYLKPSYDWLDQMMSYTKFADALDKGYVPFIAKQGGAATTTQSGVNDPFYELQDASAMTSQMESWEKRSYRVDPNDKNRFTSMWQMAYGDVVSKLITDVGQRESNYQTARAMPYEADFENLSDDQKDQVWRSFKGLYALERTRHLSTYLATHSPMRDAKLLSPTFILRFPETEEQTANQAGWTSTSDNGQQPWYPIDRDDQSQPQTLPSQITTTNAYTSRCASYIDSWKDALLKCEALKNDPRENEILNKITARMQEVCLASSDQANPFGASTLPGEGSASFESVINDVYAEYGIARDAYCNPFSIEYPKPYNKGPQLTKTYVSSLEDCNCELFAKLKEDSKAEDIIGFNEFLEQKYGKGNTISEPLYKSLSNCDKTKTTVQTGLYSKPVDYWSDETPNCNSTCDVVLPIMAPGGSSLDVGRRITDANFISKFRNGSISSLVSGGGGQTNFIQCQEGYHWDGNERDCVPNDCPPDYYWDGTQCVPTETPHTCPTGYHWDGTKCVLNPHTCPDGYHWNGTECVENSPPPVTCKHTTVSCPADPVEIRILSTPMEIPRFLQCGYGTDGQDCLTCAQMSSLIAEFKQQFGGQYNGAPYFEARVLTDEQIEANQLFARFVNFRTGYQYDWTEYAEKAAAANCPVENYMDNGDNSNPVACANTKPLNEQTEAVVQESPCDKVGDIADAMADDILARRQAQLLADFETSYRDKCLAIGTAESFTVEYPTSEYHYTLYYYDLAGNLVKTVPPKGVNPVFTDSKDIEELKKQGKIKTRDHTLYTEYRYNTLNAVVEQKSPDAGISRFWYDALGRLVVSQNARQAVEGRYSYTLYDLFGRITEVGQIKEGNRSIDQDISQDDEQLAAWIKDGYKEQITRTYYDDPYPVKLDDPSLAPLLKQNNLRNRVSWTAVYPDQGSLQQGEWDGLEEDRQKSIGFTSAIHYNYDIHGNVDVLLQDFGNSGLHPTTMNHENRFKQIRYNYDLISGKVNLVSYQPPVWMADTRTWDIKTDAFYHRYEYDAENRLTEVWTSRDSIIWNRDAGYSYYKHGSLARTVLGQLQVQGLDYAYTLQGWLKAVNPAATNSNTATNPESPAQPLPRVPIKSAANDGASGSTVAKDVYSYVLSYHPTDYISITGNNPAANIPRGMGDNYKPLYNGNIAAMGVNIVAEGIKDPYMAYGYSYDQLNRLVGMGAYVGEAVWAGLSKVDRYNERINYDPNGNITTYRRQGAENGKVMDDLSYHYSENRDGRAIGNRLRFVHDDAGKISDVDLGNQEEGGDPEGSRDDNYYYDEIGNLVQDKSESIDRIDWNVYGKITYIHKQNDKELTEISYTYDAAGNRISKHVNTSGGTAGDKYDMTTYYVRDAQGNTLVTYRDKGSHIVNDATYLYGSSRLGMIRGEPRTSFLGDEEVGREYQPSSASFFQRGVRQYELTNHLGNVLATVSDRRQQVTLDGVNTDSYEAEVMSATDYYPFGMEMPERSVSSSGYRYGFNGQEKDNEIAGTGNITTAQFWEYDSRLGRRWNVDPLTHKFPWQSPYSGLDNNPIYKTDPTGAGTESTHLDKAGKVVAVFDDGDKGVYQHGDNADGKAPTENQIKLRQTIYKSTSANGTKIGETWTSLGFADFDIYAKTGKATPIAGARINIGSTWATSKVNEILDADPDPVTYGIKARGNGPWDIKTHVPEGETWGYGSLLYGKYASARDAGNISAGMVTERSTLPNMVFDYGFGAYNKASNSMICTLKRITKDVLLMSSTNMGAKMHGLSSVINTSVNGEDKLSKQGQEMGKTMLPYYTPPPPPTKPEAPPYWQY